MIKYTIDPVMCQAVYRSLFASSFTAAINLVLSRPEAQQELTMRGVYDYRGYDDVNDFIAEYDKEKNTGIVTLENKKLELYANKNSSISL
jgi:hypothetical protein